MNQYIEVFGARQHNLKNISVRIPKNKFVVLTGVSGSGKSSLAFDTIFAEGQRRYVESLSPYARQFLGVMEKPDVDRIVGLSPAIAIDQKASSANPRSTVATITEIYDYLRLLFARIGHPHCTNCGREVRRQTHDEIASHVLQQVEGQTVGKKPVMVTILSPVIRGRKGEFTQLFEALKRDGYRRVIIDATPFDLSDDFVLIKTNKHDITVDIDTIGVTQDLLAADRKSLRSRLVEALEAATMLSDGLVIVSIDKSEHLYSLTFACPHCNISIPEIEPRTFSFNTPHGACPRCVGLGTVLSADPEATERIPGLLERYLSTENEGIRRRLSRFIISSTCPECKGTRLREEARNVTIGEEHIADVTKRSIELASTWVRDLKLSTEITENERFIAETIVKELEERLRFLNDVGLSYLTLDRHSGSLSNGEAQRIRLASQVGTGLTGILYVLDEPTIGLHSRDNEMLITTLRRLRDLGNTVLIVEHDRDTINAADWVIEIGPGAGKHGGEVMAQGTPEEIKRNKKSLTGAYLAGRKNVRVEKPINGQRDKWTNRPIDKQRNMGLHRPFINLSTHPFIHSSSPGSIKLSGASQHNLKHIDIEFPLGKLIGVTGVSGSGKSTLVHDTLYHALARRFDRAHHQLPGTFDQLIVPDVVRAVSLIDQSPIGRTSRSNPATYSGVMTWIRDLFSQTREARVRGYGPGRFSFNIPGGRCEACEGQGQIKIEMQFLPDVFIQCDTCNGTRYGKETLEVTYKNKHISDVLRMTVDEATTFFAPISTLSTKLSMLQRVGLGYIELGQPAPFLSGGEAQRLKLTRELAKIRGAHTIYILDEPTTGLHFEDLQLLIRVLRDLVALGNTVVLVEHNLDMVKNVDLIIDLGPEGGQLGGEVVAIGPPDRVMKNPRSYTGMFLAASSRPVQ